MKLKTIAMATVILSTLGSATLFAQTAYQTSNNNNQVTSAMQFDAVETALNNMQPAIDVQPATPEPSTINMAAMDGTAVNPSTVYVSMPRVREAHRTFAFVEFHKAQKIDASYTF